MSSRKTAETWNKIRYCRRSVSEVKEGLELSERWMVPEVSAEYNKVHSKAEALCCTLGQQQKLGTKLACGMRGVILELESSRSFC